MNINVTPSVMDTDNFKEYFMRHDGINHMHQELAFSVLHRYVCKAGCKKCYLEPLWASDQALKPFIPISTGPSTEQMWVRFFSAFRAVGTYDDLFMLKHNHPGLYDFYVRHSDKMVNTSMTDIAFIQQQPLLLNELSFSGVYEITFSDVFLGQSNGRVSSRVVDMLYQLHAKTPITKLKLIKSPDSDPRLFTDVCSTAVELNIPVGIHDDVLVTGDKQHHIDGTSYQERNFASYGNEPIQVMSEVMYLQHTGVYMSLVDTVNPEAAPFADIRSGMENIMVGSLREKIRSYQRYISILPDGHKMRQYFDFVCNHVVVNNHFNFIPLFVLPKWVTLYGWLCNHGWIETPHGLLRQNTKFVQPLYSFS